MKSNIFPKIAIASVSLIGGPAFARTTTEWSKMGPSAERVIMLSKEEIEFFGFKLNQLKNSRGDVRSLYPNELVKVRVHDEKGTVDFSSFDDFSVTVVAGYTTPRNIF